MSSGTGVDRLEAAGWVKGVDGLWRRGRARPRATLEALAVVEREQRPRTLACAHGPAACGGCLEGVREGRMVVRGRVVRERLRPGRKAGGTALARRTVYVPAEVWDGWVERAREAGVGVGSWLAGRGGKGVPASRE